MEKDRKKQTHFSIQTNGSMSYSWWYVLTTFFSLHFSFFLHYTAMIFHYAYLAHKDPCIRQGWGMRVINKTCLPLDCCMWQKIGRADLVINFSFLIESWNISFMNRTALKYYTNQFLVEELLSVTESSLVLFTRSNFSR